jgi:hypothetical protein
MLATSVMLATIGTPAKAASQADMPIRRTEMQFLFLSKVNKE